MGEIGAAKMLSIAGDTGAARRPEPIDLATRLRALRLARGWTLAQAAAAIGLARSTLSKIENGQMSPTYEALKKLAEGLGMSLPQLFSPAATQQAGGRRVVTRGGEGERLITPTYEHELLAQGLSAKRMLPYRARIHARRLEEFDGWVRHEGEEFLYVLTGIVRLYTESFEPAELRRGDSAYYDATMGHNLISVSEEDATVLWVTTLP